MSRDPASEAATAAIIAQTGALLAEKLPADVVEWGRHCLLDWFGIALAGVKDPLTLALLDEARAEGGNPASSVLWHGDRTSSSLAVLVNASAADALDFSDANPGMHGHTTPAIVAVALALTEARGLSGDALLRAIVSGIETACRVGLLAHGRLHPNGFHPTGTLVPFGAAAAAAELLELAPHHRAHALGLAATQGAGLVASAGTMAKPFHSGKAAMSGLLAASLAQRGVTGRADAIEAPLGFLSAHVKEWDRNGLAACADRFFIRDTKFKAHAACALTHGSIENMLVLKAKHGVVPDDIAHIDLRVPRSSLGVCNIDEPTTGLEAKFSLRATAAMALLGDETGAIAAYDTDRVTRPALKNLSARIGVTPRDDLDGGEAIAIVDLNGGRRITESCDAYRPESDLVAQRERLVRKFNALVEPLLGAARTARLQQEILSIETRSSVRELFALTAK